MEHHMKPVLVYKIYQMGIDPPEWVLVGVNGTIARRKDLKDLLALLPEEHR
jgi:hypothetical protein